MATKENIQQYIAERFKPADIEQMKATDGTGSMVLLPSSMGEAMEFAKLMAVTTAVPPHLRGKPGDCLAVTMQAMRWRMDPFAVAGKSYFVNDRLAYESQLVNAVIYAHAPLEGRLKIEYEGEGEALVCRVTGKIRDDPNPHTVVQETNTITVKNSPLWKQAPRQQLAYYTTREWARLYAPDVIMGIYTPDEMDTDSRHQGPEHAKDISPRPERADFNDTEDTEGVRVDAEGDPIPEGKTLRQHYMDKAAERQAVKDEARMKEELAGATGSYAPEQEDEAEQEAEPDPTSDEPSPAERYFAQTERNIAECKTAEDLDALEEASQEHIAALDDDALTRRLKNKFAVRRQELAQREPALGV